MLEAMVGAASVAVIAEIADVRSSLRIFLPSLVSNAVWRFTIAVKHFWPSCVVRHMANHTKAKMVPHD
jgi:hypothetical protein